MLAMIGIRPPWPSLEGDRPAQFAGPIEQLRPVFGQQRLVGRHDVLAALQQLQHDRPGRLDAADQLRHDLDLRILGDLRQVGGQQPFGQIHLAGRGHVPIHHGLQPQRPAGMPRVRSPWSSSSLATPVPIFPNPTMIRWVVVLLRRLHSTPTDNRNSSGPGL